VLGNGECENFMRILFSFVQKLADEKMRRLMELERDRYNFAVDFKQMIDFRRKRAITKRTQ